MSWLVTFLAVFVTDIAWAIYIRRVNADDTLKSVLWAMFLFGTGAVGTIGYTSNPVLLIPALAGAGLGTYVGVLWNKRKRA